MQRGSVQDVHALKQSCLQEANTAGAAPRNYEPPPDVGAALKEGATKLELPDPLKTVLPGTKVTVPRSSMLKKHAHAKTCRVRVWPTEGVGACNMCTGAGQHRLQGEGAIRPGQVQECHC